MKPPFVRSAYNYDHDQVSDQTGITFTEPSLTKQSFTEDADINVIVKRYGVTGTLPQDYRAPMYGDFTNIGDYREALEAVMDAQERFMEIPADLRAKFRNDPQELLDFLADSKNRDEAIKLGLIPKPAEPELVEDPPAPKKDTKQSKTSS